VSWVELIEENKDTIFRVLRLAIPAVLGMVLADGGSNRIAELANDGLQQTEDQQARLNDAVNYRGYVEDTIERQAKCDTTLEALHHHRSDEGDYERMLKACHSAGKIEEEEDADTSG